MKNSNAKSQYVNPLLWATFLNGVATVGGHPFDVIKTVMQVKKDEHYISIIKKIWEEQGLRGFYAGFLSNLVRQTTKTSFRTANIMMITPRFEDIRSTSILKYSLMCSLSIAVADNTLQTIFDATRIKKEVTSFDKKPSESYFEIIKQNALKSWGVGYVKTAGAWFVFFMMRERMKNRSEKNNHNTHSIEWILLTSMATSVFKIAITNPFDVIRSTMIADNLKTKEAVQKIMNNSYLGFYRGSLIRLGHGFIAAGIGNVILNKMEKNKMMPR